MSKWTLRLDIAEKLKEEEESTLEEQLSSDLGSEEQKVIIELGDLDTSTGNLSDGTQIQNPSTGVGEQVTTEKPVVEVIVVDEQEVVVETQPPIGESEVDRGYTQTLGDAEDSYLMKLKNLTRIRRGCIAVLNILYGTAIPHFPTTDRASPSSYVVLHADAKGSLGDSILKPFVFYYKEWRQIVKTAKTLKGSSIISEYVSLEDYDEAFSFIEPYLKENYIVENLHPSEDKIAQEEAAPKAVTGLPIQPRVF